MSDPQDYADRFAEDRKDTFKSMVDVWERVPEAARAFGGWNEFSMYAAAQERLLKTDLARVREAARIMQLGGYAVDTPSKNGARRWKRKGSTSGWTYDRRK